MILSFNKIEYHDLMRYYVCFLDIESKVIETINPSVKNPDLKLFKAYINSHMRIGRNFKTNTDQKILYITRSYFEGGNYSTEGLSKLFLKEQILNNKISQALVATSKLLWLFDHFTIIMDNVNKENLGVKIYDYNIYTTKWMEVYSLKKIEIDKIVDEFNLSKINPIFNEEWFKMRVFDQFLWSQNLYKK